MAREIERKFLVRNDAWRAQAQAREPMRQGYLSGGARSSVRVRIAGDAAWLNIKSARLGIERLEFEYPIPIEDARAMLDALVAGPVLEKTRHYVRHGAHTWEIDDFHGANAGLVVAEIELSHPDEPFERPDWLGEEVSHDRRYYNVALVEHPYRDW